MSGDVIPLVAAYRDRLVRFGSGLVEFILKQNGGKLVVLNEVTLSPYDELTQDLLTVLHVFSCRLHGLRKYKSEIEKDTNLSDDTSKSNAEAMAGSIPVRIQPNNKLPATKRNKSKLDCNKNGNAAKHAGLGKRGSLSN